MVFYFKSRTQNTKMKYVQNSKYFIRMNVAFHAGHLYLFIYFWFNFTVCRSDCIMSKVRMIAT
jgi:hypothetical protein